MEIIPAIDLRGGACVRLYQGDYARETVFSRDPPAVARRWYHQGAQRLHVVDLDGARTGRLENAQAIRAIVQAVPIPLEVGGGIRDLAAVAQVLEWGAERIVLGTAAVEQPDLVAQACQAYPGAIVVAVDARQSTVATRGWRADTSVTAQALVQHMAELGVPRFIYTDIARDGTATEPNFEALLELLQATDRPIIASGGVSRLQHLSQLQELGVEGVIIGQALYTGALDLRQALMTVARDEREIPP